ncbi:MULTISPECIES: hypothetical protein [Roseomonadaceae]|uniref:Uncharacterized protein n=1 Tax=Falsiroseomonas oleicola TaxID=2801474 RepID=A0ABS6HE86_9PROT|nr:hypothetical protein [Roseomonas oleicola]MBU8545801.1 hypothetical protein [Roseomonas oleicola]
MYHYAPSTGGFYRADIHGAAVPADAVPVSPDLHAALIAAQAAGQRILPGPDGAPIAQDPPPPPAPPPIRRIGALAFRRRLTPARRAAITLAASLAMEGGDASIQVWLDDLAASSIVELDDAETVAGIGALLAADLITEAERDALLADGLPTEAA